MWVGVIIFRLIEQLWAGYALNMRRHYFMAVMIHEIMRMHTPDYLVSLLTRYVPRSVTRGEINELSAPLMRTDAEFKSFSVQGEPLWNSLPTGVRHLPLLSRFKTSLRKHLLDLN